VPDLSDSERRHVEFPVFYECQSFKAKKAVIQRSLGPEFFALLEKLRLYNGGNELLWGLHFYDILDKHRQLLICGHVVTVISRSSSVVGYGVVGQAIVGGPRGISWRWQPLEEEIVLYSVPFSSEHKPQPRHVINISLGDIDALRKVPVIKLLNDLTDLVERIVGVFEKRFSG
jgi:hypothetical protein